MLRTFLRQHLELQPLQIDNVLLSVAIAIDEVKLVSGDDVHGVFRHVLSPRRFHVGIHDTQTADDSGTSDEIPEGGRLGENDEQLTLFQAIGNLQQVLWRQVAPTELLTGLVVPATVVNEVVTPALATTKIKQVVARLVELLPVHTLNQLRLHAFLLPVVGC
ncbi:MAG: hypothetical protein KBD24_03250 [Candidatus Pacebacteria bacterium]|nr:hypothetical protein [Candidatus Paceibacterota bacterium]